MVVNALHPLLIMIANDLNIHLQGKMILLIQIFGMDKLIQQEIRAQPLTTLVRVPTV